MKRLTERPQAFWATAAVCILILAYGVHRTMQPGQGQDQAKHTGPPAQPMQAAASAPLLSDRPPASSQTVAARGEDPCELTSAINPFVAAPTTPASGPVGKVQRVKNCVVTAASAAAAASASASLSDLLEAELTSNSVNQGLVRWSNLTPAAENGSVASANTNASQSSDGILINIDRPIEGLGKIIQASLEAGQIVVLDTSGGEANRQKIQELTLEYGSMGVWADAVMLYKSAANAEVSVLPYDAADKKELASLMSVVGRRGAGKPGNQ